MQRSIGQNERGFTKGLVEIGDGVHAYVQPDGTWGWSNAGVVVGDGESTLVDTLFDLKLTTEMPDAMAPLTAPSPITNVVNTHANGDHCYGNQLVAGPGVDFIASAATAAEFPEVPASLLATMVDGAGPLGQFIRSAFGPFDFGGIDVPEATIEFTDRHQLDAGRRTVELIEIGPAHTAGDIIAWLPDDRVLFTGDILFIGGTPIMWAGPIGNWIDACKLIEELNPELIVPGHGPITDVAGVAEARSYLEYVQTMATERFAAGVTAADAVRDIDLAIDGTRYGSWTDRERLVVTVHGIWKELDPTHQMPDIITVFELIAADFTSRQGGQS